MIVTAVTCDECNPAARADGAVFIGTLEQALRYGWKRVRVFPFPNKTRWQWYHYCPECSAKMKKERKR